MKQVIFSTTLLFFATQVNADINYQKELKKEFDETATTVVGKFEKNSYTLINDFEKCGSTQNPIPCYQKVLKDVENEQTKNTKSIRNCVITNVGFFTLNVAASALASLVLPQEGVQADKW